MNCRNGKQRPAWPRVVLLFVTVLALGAWALDGADARTRSYAVMDFETGVILSAVNENERLHPASLTKMMTLYLTFEAIRDGRFSLDQRVRVSKRASSMPPSRLGLRAGQRVRLRHLIASAAVRSANDAAVVLAETVGGTEWKFAEMMTRKARSFGMNGTTFKNATGFTAKGHRSTARDMAILGRRLLRDFPEHASTFSRLSIRWGGRILRATNSRFLQAFRGADGIKTGYTRAAGYTIVATANRKGRRLITSYFGASSSGRRANRVAELMTQGFEQLAQGGVLVAQRSNPPTTRPEARPEKKQVQSVASVPPPDEAPPPRPGARPAAVQSELAEARSETGTEAVLSASPDDSPALAMVPASPPETPDISLAVAPPGNWAIQVGAYSRREQAEARLRNVNKLHADITGNADQRAPKRNRYYLARFNGFSENGARTACRMLRSRRVDCLPIIHAPAEEPAAVSAATQAIETGSPEQWAIQVGAYSRKERAEAHLRNVSATHVDITSGTTPWIPRRNRNYLAQFIGFDERGAKSACGTLRSRGVDCLPIIPSDGPAQAAMIAAAKAVLPGAGRQWLVQVGAYSRQEQAVAHLRNVAVEHGDIVGVATPLTPKRRRYYLAQFAGFGEDDARSACRLLRKRGVDCLPLAPSRTGEPAAVAAASEAVLRISPGKWAVQVGAFAREEQAEAHLRNVNGAHADITASATPMARAQNRLFLARFEGFDEDAARSACGTFRKRGVDCFPVAPSAGEDTLVVAAAPDASQSPATGRWAIQVGAYSRKEQAETHLHNVNGAHADITGSATPIAPKRNRYYLAQFAGFDEGTAKFACETLQRRGVDCLPIAASDIAEPTIATAVAAAGQPPAEAEPVQPPAAGEWAVQVGAYSRAQQARAQIDRLRRQRDPQLSNREFQVARSGRLFLAWFTGFDETSAKKACRALEERRTDCLAVRTGRERIGGSLTADSGWTVQVGAFRRDRDASRHLENVRKAGLQDLAGREGSIERRGRYHFVQFEPFNADEAHAACDTLLRRGIDCLVKSNPGQSAQSQGRSDWAIQVGAYRRATQARAQLNRVMGKSLSELQGARHWVPQQGRLYLARLRNLSQQSANAACDALRSDGMDCLPLAPSRN